VAVVLDSPAWQTRRFRLSRAGASRWCCKTNGEKRSW
jgi:hypothetical protein